MHHFNLLLVHWTLNPGSHLKTHFFFLPLGLFFGSGLQWNLPEERCSDSVIENVKMLGKGYSKDFGECSG